MCTLRQRSIQLFTSSQDLINSLNDSLLLRKRWHRNQKVTVVVPLDPAGAVTGPLDTF